MDKRETARKLKESEIADMKRLYDAGYANQKTLAQMFDVSASCVQKTLKKLAD